jgi:hypothetical protein
MRFLKVLVIGMGVLIVVATTVLIVLIVHRLGGAAPAKTASASVLLDQPLGTRIVGIAAADDRLALHLQGGGPDRVVLVEPRTGAVMGTIGIAGQ